MFGQIKKRFQAWFEQFQQSEIQRLLEENTRLKQKIDRESGRSIQLTPEQQRRLAELFEGMDEETLKKISVLGRQQISASRGEKELLENS